MSSTQWSVFPLHQVSHRNPCSLHMLEAGPSLALLFTVDVKIFIALLSEASGH